VQVRGTVQVRIFDANSVGVLLQGLGSDAASQLQDADGHDV
jgi:hypothetical protein